VFTDFGVSLADDLAAALDAVSFARSLGFDADPWQVQALRWSGRRLLLNCCRQAGKSTTAALLAVHRALYSPGSLILLVSPSLRQSSELFRKVGEWLTKLPEPPAMPEDNRLSCVLANGSRIVSLPSSESTVRGFSGVDLIIEDEAARVPDDLYRAVRPMLAVSGGRLILMSTPFGKRGHFFEAWANGGPAWERIELAASANARIAPAFLAEERSALGDLWYRQEYECAFLDAVNQVFGYDLVMGALSDDILPLFGEPGTFSTVGAFEPLYAGSEA
jgi:hypothetical protein